jgi:hypothetical protein
MQKNLESELERECESEFIDYINQFFKKYLTDEDL